MGVQLNWNEARRHLSLHLYKGSRMLPPWPRVFNVGLNEVTRRVVFAGENAEVSF